MYQLVDLKIAELRQSITKSGLNFLLRESPFGLKIEIRKSLARPTTILQNFNPSIPPPPVNTATTLAPEVVRPPCSTCPGLVAVAETSKKAAADALCQIKSMEMKESICTERLERCEVARNAAEKDVSLLQNEIAALKINLQNKETLLKPEIPTKVGHNAENLERSELARNAAEKQVSLLQNELKTLKIKFDDERSQLKSEISTKTEQLKRKNKTLEQIESSYKREKENTERNTQTLENKCKILLSKNAHLQKKLDEASEELKKTKAEAKKDKKKRRGKEKACQTLGNSPTNSDQRIPYGESRSELEKDSDSVSREYRSGPAQLSHQNPEASHGHDKLEPAPKDPPKLSLLCSATVDQDRNRSQPAPNASDKTVEEPQNVAPICPKDPKVEEPLANVPDNVLSERDQQLIKSSLMEPQTMFAFPPLFQSSHGQEDSVAPASDDKIVNNSESLTTTRISVSPFPNLSPLQRVQQVFLFHHNLLKERPTQEELNIERYKSTNRYSPHIPPTNTAAINLQLHTLSVATPKIISSYQNVDNLIKAFKNDITYDDPDSIYPALCIELEKITPKELTTSIAPTTTTTTTLIATTTSSTRTGICNNVSPASMIFQAQPEELINAAPEEDPMVKDLTTQPRLEPLPSSSTFQPQKKDLVDLL